MDCCYSTDSTCDTTTKMNQTARVQSLFISDEICKDFI